MPTTQLRQPSPIMRTHSVVSTSSSTLAGSFRQNRPDRARVLPPSQELWTRARDTRAAIDFRALTDLAVSRWRWKASNHGFALFKRQVAAATASSSLTHEVLSTGEIRCSVAELVHILRPEGESEHNAIMQALYRKDYIHGSSVRVASTTASLDRVRTEVSSTKDASTTEEQLAVKTSSFVRANLFAKHEQWCYLEHFQATNAIDPSAGFTVTIASMSERDEQRAGKRVDRERVNDLRGVVAGYLVETVPNERLLRVLFYAQYTPDTTNSSSAENRASAATTRARIAFLAKGATRLPEVVRRRRLGAQTFADRSAFAATNRRCVCCTKSLHMFSKKKRCALCGYFVCDKDWSVQTIETRSGAVTAARVCTRCMEAVEFCDYAQLSPRELGVPPQIVPTPDGLLSPTATVATFLHDALASASSESKKESVKAVIKHLVTPEKGVDKAIRSLTLASSEHEYHAALDAYLHVESLPLDQCVLANAEARTYGISVSDRPGAPDAPAPAHPVAANEAERLSAIEREYIDQIGNADEFNIIASLAARELECYASLVTVITDSEQLVLGANLADLQALELPRTHAFCAHTILDDKPLVVPHPEADVRFASYIPVKQLGARFYCGFPIVARDSTVVGSVCCLDMKSHELTQAQYATMVKLADTASRVMQLKGQEIESRAKASSAAAVSTDHMVYKHL